MASGGMSWQYYNNNPQQKYNPHSSASHGAGMQGCADNSAAGDMQDMHLKMSKKIAQLTKVIYALNTKNDEHDAAMAALKDAHEEEVQQLLAETTVKLQEYRNKIGDQLDLRKKVQNLEECVSGYEREKQRAIGEFERYKHDAERLQLDAESRHVRTIDSMSRDLSEAKLAFQSRIGDFERALADSQREKGKNLDSVLQEYKLEVARIGQELEDQQVRFDEERGEAERKHSAQAEAWTREAEELRDQVRKLHVEEEEKMAKAKAFYEHELAVLRGSIVSDQQLAQMWQEKEQRLRADANETEARLKAKMKQLNMELEVKRDEVQELNQRLSQSNSESKSTSEHIKSLRDQLSKLQQEAEASRDKLLTTEDDLKAVRSRVEQQVQEISQKSSIIATMEAIKTTQDETIGDLESQLGEMRRKLVEAEAGKDMLLHSQNEEHGHLLLQLKALSERIESAESERGAAERELKRVTRELRAAHDDEMDQIKSRFEAEISTLVKQHQQDVDNMKQEAEDEMEKVRRKAERAVIAETTRLETEKAELSERAASEKTELSSHLDSAQKEVTRLNEVIEKHESGLGDASSHIQHLKSRIASLESSLHETDQAKRSALAAVDQLRREMGQEVTSYEEKLASRENRHMVELERLKKEKDDAWESDLRTKLAELRASLLQQYREERRNALDEMTSQKEREMEVAKSGWEEQIRAITQQMTEMRRMFDDERRDFEVKLEEGRSNVTSLERRLRHEADDAAADYSAKVKQLVDAHKAEIIQAERAHEDAKHEIETRLANQHRDELHSQLRAHQVTMETIRDQMRREKAEALERKEEEFQIDMDEVRCELMQRNAAELDDIRREYATQINQTNLELENLKDHAARNDESLKRKLSEMEADMQMTSSQLNGFRQKTQEQGDVITALNKELDVKGKEVLHVRSEANLEMRRREEELQKMFQQDQDRVEAERLRHKQQMVNEFNRAVQALKDKSTQLEIALREANEQYERRESRPEDLELIERLKHVLHEREEQIQKILDDKKFFEMELVNRETNFNKVFNNSPNVGLINPRSNQNAKKKKGVPMSNPSRFTSQFFNVPNMSSIEPALTGQNRLEPIRSNGGASSPLGLPQPPKPVHQPTPPSMPKKFLRTDDDYFRFRDLFSDEATTRLDSVLGDDDVIRTDCDDVIEQNNRFQASRFTHEQLQVWRSQLDLMTSHPRKNVMSPRHLRTASKCASLPDGYHGNRQQREHPNSSFFASFRKKKK